MEMIYKHKRSREIQAFATKKHAGVVKNSPSWVRVQRTKEWTKEESKNPNFYEPYVAKK